MSKKLTINPSNVTNASKLIIDDVKYLKKIRYIS